MVEKDKEKSDKRKKVAEIPAAASTVPPETITQTLLAQVPEIAKRCRASAIFVYTDVMVGKVPTWPDSLKSKVYYITRTSGEEENRPSTDGNYIQVPNVQLSRLGQVKIAIFLALAQSLIKQGDTIVCVSGMAESGTLDTIVVSQVGREYEMFSTTNGNEQTPKHIQAEVLERIINLASQLGSEGREGKPVGGLFVIGDSERVISMTRQLVLNPFQGYPEKDRNILDESFEETVKEFSTIDGAFIIRGDGVVETCGAYLKTASQKEFELPRGLGARHHAAAAITAVTDGIAVVVSESTGTVTIFRSGKILTEIEKPRRIGRSSSSSPTSENNPFES